MPITSWVRDFFGIMNDAQAAKKIRLEIEKIEDEKRGKLIIPATVEDVKKYDSKTQALITKIERHELICLVVLTGGTILIALIYYLMPSEFWEKIIPVAARILGSGEE